MATDPGDWAAYIRSIKVPPNMGNSRQFVDYMAGLAAANRNASGREELNQTIAHVTGALLEVINALGAIDEHFRKGGA
jgi:hypothetical protein